MTHSGTGWEESASQLFIDFGNAFTPSRAEQANMIVSLIPAAEDEEFVVADLACGAGWLSEAVLVGFPRCRVSALDGSPVMLERARESLRAWSDRVELRLFDLKNQDWLGALPGEIRCFVSSLAIHHLDGGEKQAFFRRIAEALPPGGALLIADLIEPINERARRAYAVAWDRAVSEQSERQQGNQDAFDEFRRQRWNLFEYPDPDFDKPSKLFDQLLWLRDAGFREVDCFWLSAGHAVYGGYR